MGGLGGARSPPNKGITMKLAGKIAIVTGTSPNIGAGIAGGMGVLFVHRVLLNMSPLTSTEPKFRAGLMPTR